LRAAGCPEQTVEDIVVIRLSREIRSRALQIAASLDQSQPYWRTTSPQAADQLQNQIRELKIELDEKVESLLGSSRDKIRSRLFGWPERITEKNYLRTEQMTHLREIERRHLALTEQKNLSDSDFSNGFSERERGERLGLEREKLEEIKAALSPAEFELYMARSSPASGYVRRYLPEAKSEEEYKRMLQVAVEFQMGHLNEETSSNDDHPEALARRESFQKRLQEVLGEDRIAEEKAEEERRSQVAEEEDRQRSFTKLAEKSGLAREEIEAFYRRVKKLEPELNSRFDRAIKEATTPESRKDVEIQIKAEAMRIATELFGAQKAEVLVRSIDED